MGSLLLNPYRAILVETDEQLVHVARYIHLNRYTGYKLTYREHLFAYDYSSLPEYFGSIQDHPITNTSLIQA
jgi:hypothetical protein